MKKSIKLLTVLVFGLLLIITNCQNDYNNSNGLDSNLVNKSIIKDVTAEEIPDVMNYIISKSNEQLQFELKGTQTGATYRTHEDNLILTEVLTEQIKESTNNFGKSNYTFEMTKDEDGDLYFLNLVVKEFGDSYFAIILKYVPEKMWFLKSKGKLDYSKFTGDVYFYNEEGVYFAKAAMVNGYSTNTTQRDPCDSNDNDNNNDDNDSNGDDYGYNSDDNGDNGNGGGNGGNSWEYQCWEYTVGANHDEDGPTTVTVCKWVFVGGIQRTFTDAMRNPCGGSGSGGYSNNNDDCYGSCNFPMAFDANCNCDEQEAMENPDMVTLPLGGCKLSDDDFNEFYSDNSPFDVDLGSVRSNCEDHIENAAATENTEFMCIYNALASSPKFKMLFVDTFGEDSDLKIKIELADLAENNAGNTTAESGTLNDLKIQINRSHLNTKHPLQIAQTIIHEALHAYLKGKKVECTSGTTLPDLDNVEIDQLLAEYNYSCLPNSTSEHNLMFDILIPYMESVLDEVRPLLVAESDSNPDINFYPPPTEELETWSWDDALFYLTLDGLQMAQSYNDSIVQNVRHNYLDGLYRGRLSNPTFFNLDTCE